MSLSWLVPVAAASAVGSLHCVGMCGGLIAVAGAGSRGLRERLMVQLVYQSGRLVSYVALGALAGSLGRALDVAGGAAGVGRMGAVVAGGAMALWGLWAMLGAAGVKVRLPRLRVLPNRALTWLGSMQKRGPTVRAALLGSASGLLPCGFLYGFALAAAATGSAAKGAAVMGAFWLGNLPALLGFGFFLSGAVQRLGRHLPMLSAVTVFALGVFTLNERINLPALALESASRAAPTAIGGQALPNPADCPHHRKHGR
ncbi:MAG: putative rane protein [Polyangiaceae bacterium]|nr:putative rane protein [Polyangiaceae bacterium]